MKSFGSLSLVGCAIALAALFVGSSLAGEKDQPAMSAQDAAHMQEVMQRYMTPDQHHKNLDPLAGKWDYTSTFWMEPGGEPMTSTGTSENTWAHGGRFLMQSVKGTIMGQEFTGTGVTGYDRFNNEYHAYWIDSMGTGYMLSSGSANDKGSVFTFEGTYDDCWTGTKDMWARTVVSIESPNAHKFEMFQKGADGKPWKNMEISYTRAGMASK